MPRHAYVALLSGDSRRCCRVWVSLGENSMGRSKPKPPKHRSLSDNARQRLVWRQLKDADDRTAAIVAAGFIEHELARAIMARLRPLSPSEHNRLFDGYGALSSFSQKIDFGYALRIYDKAERKELEAIKAIRNHFAHSIHTKTFNNPKVRKECRALLGHKFSVWLSQISKHRRLPRQKTLRRQFLTSVLTTYVVLIAGVKKAKRPTVVSELSFEAPLFRTWLETGAPPVPRAIRQRGNKILPPPRQLQSSQE